MCRACDLAAAELAAVVADLEGALAGLEVDELERELDVKAGLVPAWARRGLLPHERAAGVNFAELDAAVETHASTIAGALRHHRTRIAGAVSSKAQTARTPAELVDLVNRLGDPARPITADVPGYDRLTRDLEQLVAGELAGAYRSGLASARAEADAQGVPVVAIDRLVAELEAGALDPAIAAQAKASAAMPARVVTQAVAAAGARWPLANLDLADGVDKITTAAAEDLAAGLDTDGARTPASSTHAAGRAAAQDALPKAARWYASELLDRNTCGPCSLVDGVEYPSLEAARVDYPAGQYVGCQGGSRCRGTLVTVWDTEAKATRQDVAPVPRPEPPTPPGQPSPGPTPNPSPPGAPSELRKGRKLTALERDEALVDLAAETEFTPEELRGAWAQLEELRKAARAEAARTQAAARGWFTGGHSPLDGLPGPPMGTALARPPKARRVVDIHGRARMVRGGGGEWDWLEQVQPGELARLQKHGWFSDTGQGPDELARLLNGARGVSTADADVVTLEDAVDQWLAHSSLTDAAGSVARGRPFGAGHRISYADICPELEAEGWDVEVIVGAQPSTFDPEAILHVARHADVADADVADTDAAERELFDAFRSRTGGGSTSFPDYSTAPAPWTMTTESYRGELLDVEQRLREAEFTDAGPAAVDVDRWHALVTVDDVDEAGRPLSVEELHARMVDLANRAKMPGARPLEDLNATPEDLARRQAEAAARKAAHDQAVANARAELEARKAAADAARRQAEEEARRAAEEEAARQAAEAEARRLAEEEARRKAAELEDARRRAEEEAARRAELERIRREEEARKAAELEAQRRAAEEEARRRAAEEAAQRVADQLAREAQAQARAEADAARAAAEARAAASTVVSPLDPKAVQLAAGNTRAGNEVITRTLNDLARITGVEPDKFLDEQGATEIIWRRGKRGQSKGGHYSPSSRAAGANRPPRKRGESYAAYRARVEVWLRSPKRPEIVVVDVPDGVIPPRLALLHEFGHRADSYTVDLWHTQRRNVLSRVAEVRRRKAEGLELVDRAVTTAAEELTDPEDALVAFLSVAHDQPVIAHPTGMSARYLAYHRDPREIWARFYAQWSATEIGGLDDDLETMRRGAGYMMFTDDEYAAMLPAFRAVLRTRGLLK